MNNGEKIYIDCKDDLFAIQKAIDNLPAEGGTIIIPKGEWLTGPIHLKNNVELHLEKDSVLKFSQNFSDYTPAVFTRWEGVECYNYSPFIYALNCENISITGKGVLDGQGPAWWHWKQLQGNAADRLCKAQSQNIPVEKRVFATEEDALRPSFIQFIGCRNVFFEDFTIINGPQWTIHPVYCENVQALNLTVKSCGPNTDGFNPDSCKNVLIDKCTFNTGDDCIAINSGLNEDGWRVNRPCVNVEIRNCTFLGGHAAVAIGSGMSGGIETINVHNCEIKNTERGIRLKSMRGRGGYIKNVDFSNITMNNVELDNIEVSMDYGSSTAVPVSLKAPDFSDIHFENISGKGGKFGISAKGLEESHIKNMIIKNMNVEAEIPLKQSYADLTIL